jgi:hypothetical protein
MHVSSQEIQTLEIMLAGYHAQHALKYGCLSNCAEPKCLEVKMGIEWLKARVVASRPETKSILNH